MKFFLVFFIILSSSIANASTTDCQDLYVGRIWVEKGSGLKGVVYLNHPNNTSGSYWSYFAGWSESEKKEALSILMMAKAAKHKINVVTENADGCGLQASSTITKAVYLATNP